MLLDEYVNTGDEYEPLVTFIRSGLNTDGGAHKQWYLEKLLLLLVGADVFKTFAAGDGWEEGTAP